MLTKLLFLTLVFITLPLYAAFEPVAGKFGVGLNYPGLSAKYCFSNKVSAELKGQFDTGISIFGLRGYYYFMPEAKIKYFAGLEADTVNFKGTDSEGSGFVGEVFAGGEYYFAKNLTLQLDFGPAFIGLTDKNYSISQSGMEFVINLGVNLYFGKGGK